MSINTRHSYRLSVKRATRRRRRQQTCRSCLKPNMMKSNKCNKGKSNKLSQKLQALKSLIPSHNNNDDVAMEPDQLFEETADYIVLLRIRVVVLQKLIEFYGNNTENENVVLL